MIYQITAGPLAAGRNLTAMTSQRRDHVDRFLTCVVTIDAHDEIGVRRHVQCRLLGDAVSRQPVTDVTSCVQTLRFGT